MLSDKKINELLIALDETVDSLESGISCDDNIRKIVRDWFESAQHRVQSDDEDAPAEDEGLKIWQEWFEWDGNPWVNDDYGNTYCFFCDEGKPNHHEPCAYIKAQTLLGRLQDKRKFEITPNENR